MRMAGDRAFHAADVDVQPEWVRDKLGEIQLIDVREDYEWEAGRLEGARHIELQQVASEAATIDRETPVVFYCRVGGRGTGAGQARRLRPPAVRDVAAEGLTRVRGREAGAHQDRRSRHVPGHLEPREQQRRGAGPAVDGVLAELCEQRAVLRRL